MRNVVTYIRYCTVLLGVSSRASGEGSDDGQRGADSLHGLEGVFHAVFIDMGPAFNEENVVP